MNEEILENGAMTEEPAPTEEDSPEEKSSEEKPSREEELSAALEAAREENELLRAKCICGELGVPKGLCEDIIALGSFYAKRDGVGFEEAARAAFARISAAARIPAEDITTGVSVQRSISGASSLRRAFGLKD